MRLTIARALDVYFEEKIDVFDVEQLKRLNDEQIKKLCKRLNVSPLDFPTVLKESFYGISGPDNENKSKSGNDKNEKINVVKIVELLGESGLNNFDITPFELLAYLRGTRRRDWSTTSAVMATVHNSNCSKQSQLKSPRAFNPTLQDDERQDKKTFEDLFNRL